jgi:hypothetical protein
MRGTLPWSTGLSALKTGNLYMLKDSVCTVRIRVVCLHALLMHTEKLKKDLFSIIPAYVSDAAIV